MTLTSGAPRRSPTAVAEGLYWLDAAIEFINVEKWLITRQVSLQSNGDIIRSFSSTVRTFGVIIAHAFFYQIISRNLPGSISYLDFVAGGFGPWMTFSYLRKHAAPSFGWLPSNIPLRIRWINLVVAEMIWGISKITLGVALCYLFFVVLPNRAITGDGQVSVNLPALFGTFALAAVLGLGFGMMFRAAQTAFPVLDAVMEVISWFMFISSGIYDTYTSLPAVVRPIFQLNPMMTVNEFTRAIIHPGYPTGELTITYPICWAIGTVIFGLLVTRHQKRVEVP